MNSEHNQSSNKNFGIVFFIVFILISLYPLLNSENIRFWALIISLTFLFLGILNSQILTPLNKLWFKFGILIGSIMAPIVMGVVFFLVVTPTGLIMKALGKKMLDNKFDKNKKSYWINREKQNNSMRKQF